MDVQAYLEKKCRERWRSEQTAMKEKEEQTRKKMQAYLEPAKQLTGAYLVNVGAKSIDLKDPTQLVNKEIFDQLQPDEKLIYEETHAKSHFVVINRTRIDLKDNKTKISRVQYDQLSREDKQIYLVAHPRNPDKPINSNKISDELREYLDQKYGEKGSKGWKKLSTSSFKIA